MTVSTPLTRSSTTCGGFARASPTSVPRVPMPNRLLDRQASLLAYLTSGAAIFGERNGVPLDQALHGMDSALLRLEARFSYEKRLEKIASVFPRTIAMLGDAWGPIFR